VKSDPTLTVEPITQVTRVNNLPKALNDGLWVKAKSDPSRRGIPIERRGRKQADLRPVAERPCDAPKSTSDITHRQHCAGLAVDCDFDWLVERFDLADQVSLGTHSRGSGPANGRE